MSSFSAMDSDCDCWSHCTWKQASPCYAAHPHDPEASVNKCVLGRSDGGLRNDVPFHRTVNSAHHARSALNPWLSLMGTLLAGGRCTACSREIMRRKKARPGRITLQAWFNKPISDSSSLRVQLFLLSHCTEVAVRRGYHNIVIQVVEQ